NSQKVYVGIIKGLNDMVLMARKKDFEKKFRSAVDAKPELKKKYGDTWSKIDELVQEKRKIAAQRNNTNGYEIYMKIQELSGKEDYYKQVLGRALYDVYGTSIPPDATFTLRISDGVIKSYEYNGTIAPPKTTFYGMYDRYYSFAKQYPWSLNERWINPPAEFNLETPFNFISTNDIIGGNSGSPIINKDAEIVGLVFDGNIESMSDEFIYSSDAPHTVSVDSQGLYEVIKDMYKVTRLAQEIENGKIVK
ncbi:MAG: S46 family peptidase, partial [Ignavibacteriae bacterium]|nr:S46 family peptidase [Ignavibacteriota bacterium]